MEVRSTAQRVRDGLVKLETEVDLWVPSVSDHGDAYLVPLSFGWVDDRIVMATPDRSITARNLVRAGTARVGIGPTRDVMIVEGPIRRVEPATAPEWCDVHARQAGFDARGSDDQMILLVLEPRTIQAWRNPAELANRTIMRDGSWLA